MLRRVLLSTAAIGAALVSTPSAHAGDVCYGAGVSFLVTVNTGPRCDVPYGGGTICSEATTTVPGGYVWRYACVPNPHPTPILP
jgi:hypothetical protein